MQIDPAKEAKIAELIHSDSSPVGIDAKKTHILIIHMLQEMQAQLDDLRTQVNALKSSD